MINGDRYRPWSITGDDEVDDMRAVVRAGLEHLAGFDGREQGDGVERAPRGIRRVDDAGDRLGGERFEAIPCGVAGGEELVERARAEFHRGQRADAIADDESGHGAGIGCESREGDWDGRA